MIKLLQSSWVISAIAALLYALTTFLCWRTPEAPQADDAKAAAQATHAAPSWEFTNPELEQLMTDLKTERTTLNQREQQLNDLAARLKAERLEINQVTQAVHQFQAELDQTVLRVHDEETANLKKLAKMYAAMATEGAAAIMRELEDGTVVKIMVFMKEEEAAPILESLAKRGDAEAKRAAMLSERLRLTVFRKTSDKAKP
jgi:flagellar motility protein MotE (MotC chaperone)